ncbi:MAG: PorP/SprF family type IX secretion system membrane protein [Flavobacteriales bacterium]|nr:PorP/SprF family type IX secretion system membrane protein [Flavobacteriales bacterium]
MGSFCAKAQDSHLSMYYAAPNLLNPAMTGRHVDAYYRAHIQYRTQWYALTGTPFTTMAASFDKSYRKFGFGINAKNTKAGTGGYSVMNVVLSGAYEITNDPLRIHHLSTGMQLGFIQKSINSKNFTYDNQYSKDYNGGDFDGSLASNEFYATEAILLPELNFGLYYYRTDKNKIWNPYAGISAFHLTTPEETFLGVKNDLPMRFVGYGGTSVKLNWLYRVDANFQLMREGNVSEIVGGALIYYEPEREDLGFFIGPYYRNKDAFQLHLGVEVGEWTVRVAYDLTTSTLGSINKKQGGVEFGITYTKHKGKYIPSIL